MGISEEMEKLTTQKHNSFFEPIRTSHDYLSSDKKKVDEYVADELCGYPNTTQFGKILQMDFKTYGAKQLSALLMKNSLSTSLVEIKIK